MKTITIMTNDGLRDVWCYGEYGNYAVTKATYGSGYVVTHIQTGLAARSGLSLHEARIMARIWNVLVPNDLYTEESRRQFVQTHQCLWAVLTGLNSWCGDDTERQKIEHLVETLRAMVEPKSRQRQEATL